MSSGIVCVGLSKDSFPISVPQSNSVVQSNSEVYIVALNKSSRMLAGNHAENCLQRSPFDDRYQNNYEEHFVEPYGEVALKLFLQKQRCLPLLKKSNFQWMIIVLKIVLFIKSM